MRKLQLIQNWKMEQENEHIAAYKRIFPHTQPTCFQMDLIEGTITDARAWEQTLTYWAGNDYRPQSIGKMLDYYRQVTQGTVKTFDDPVKVSMKVGAPEPTVKTYNCDTCFDVGKVEGEWISSNLCEIVPCPKCTEAA